MSKKSKRNNRRNINNENESVNEDLLVRAPALNPDDVEIGDEINPEDRLSAGNLNKNNRKNRNNRNNRNNNQNQ
ncbi:MAG: hypothetical protein ACOCQO_00490 [Halanaerobiaceae bacterium]